MRSDAITSHTRALTDLGGQRVWSLLVSVFGDLAQDKGAAIPGPVLSEIMTAMDVRPEATRVALHRLRRDGWITSRKTGRTSLHALTAHGRSETVAASKRIYAEPGAGAQNWQIILTPADTDEVTLRARGYAQIMPRAWIGKRGLPGGRQAVCLTGDTLPVWVREALAPASLCAEYTALFDTLTEIGATLPAGAMLPPVSHAVLRCLIVHNWRRLVLKHPDLPEEVFPDTWRGHDCHRLVHALLGRLTRPTLAELAG